MRRLGWLSAGTLIGLALFLVHPADAQEVTLAGCLSGEPGNYILGAIPSGKLYRLQGNPKLLLGYGNRLIRVAGTQSAPSGSQQGVFQVQRVEQISDTCTTPLPARDGQEVRPATGKTAEQSVAVNTSSTASLGLNTPGAETESGQAQRPGRWSGVSPDTGSKPDPLAPPVWGQVGQAPQEGNHLAAAAERAEEYLGHTLGVNATPEKAPAAANNGRE